MIFFFCPIDTDIKIVVEYSLLSVLRSNPLKDPGGNLQIGDDEAG